MNNSTTTNSSCESTYAKLFTVSLSYPSADLLISIPALTTNGNIVLNSELGQGSQKMYIQNTSHSLNFNSIRFRLLGFSPFIGPLVRSIFALDFTDILSCCGGHKTDSLFRMRCLFSSHIFQRSRVEVIPQLNATHTWMGHRFLPNLF